LAAASPRLFAGRRARNEGAPLLSRVTFHLTGSRDRCEWDDRLVVRSREQRVKDTLAGLRTEVDAWVATASSAGRPHLVPLSFYWNGEMIIVTTVRSSRTGRNFLATARARVAIGQTRGNVVVIDARVEEMPIGENVELENAYVQATDFDPRPWDVGYTFFRLTPERMQTWRGDDADELRDPDVMREGRFL
jgi:Pyridoxamine 5'-phosphate oxidase